MRSLNPDIKDLHSPGAVEAEHVLKMLHEHEIGNPDQAWRAKIFRAYPRRFAHRMAREYEEIYLFESRRNANLYLLDHWDRCQKKAIPLSSSDYELEQMAKKHANEMRVIASVIHDDVKAVVRLWPLAKEHGIRPPSLTDPNITPRGVLHRLFDDQWWLRQLRKSHAKNLEEEAIRLGFVHQHAGTYISDETFARFQEQKKRNTRILSRLVAMNEVGQIFQLEHLIARGMANPKNRRNELMCRVFGFETIANQLGHIADFMTLTCPSRMHARLSKSGEPNPKYDGTTPAEAQRYLTKVWSRIRAKLKRDGIEIYGFRVAEPHQDGTPHWHLLVFSEESQIENIRAIFAHYALEENGNEQGALEHRFTYKPIDKTKGSAIGYIAKYVSKNIDGYAIEQDENGLDAKDSANRVTAWASTWGIRQFQQFGGVPVTLWRELRKVKISTPEGILTEAFEAADSGNWSRFLEVLGGPAPHRKDLPIQLVKEESNEVGKYGDPVGLQIIGVIANTVKLSTRAHQWSVMTIKQLIAKFEIKSVNWSAFEGEPLGVGTDAEHRPHPSGEAALEFCQ
jgi:hypothetical protein